MPQVDRYETRYTSKWDGQQKTHVHTGTENGARGWNETLAQTNDSKAETVAVYTDGTTRHVISTGDNSK